LFSRNGKLTTSAIQQNIVTGIFQVADLHITDSWWSYSRGSLSAMSRHWV